MTWTPTLSRDFNGDHVVYPSLSLGCTTIVKSLLDHPKADRDPNLVVSSISHQTGLMRACEIGDLDIVKLYLDREGIDLNRRDHKGFTALDKAIASYRVTRDRLEVIKLLLGRDSIDLNHNARDGLTVLHRACAYVNLLGVDLLLKRKDVDPNARDNSGATPLTYACCNPGWILNHRNDRRDRDKLDLVSLFLTHPDIDPNPVDNSGLSNLQNVIEFSGRYGPYLRKVESLLRRYGAICSL
jgi:ankyrin repeat protein